MRTVLLSTIAILVMACQKEEVEMEKDFQSNIEITGHQFGVQEQIWSFDTETDLAIIHLDSIQNYTYGWTNRGELQLSHYATVLRNLQVRRIDPPEFYQLEFIDCSDVGFEAVLKVKGDEKEKTFIRQ